MWRFWKFSLQNFLFRKVGLNVVQVRNVSWNKSKRGESAIFLTKERTHLFFPFANFEGQKFHMSAQYRNFFQSFYDGLMTFLACMTGSVIRWQDHEFSEGPKLNVCHPFTLFYTEDINKEMMIRKAESRINKVNYHKKVQKKVNKKGLPTLSPSLTHTLFL